MKTDVVMTVAFSEGGLEIRHKSTLVEINDMFRLGNIYRLKSGRAAVNVTEWFSNKKTAEFIEIVAKNLGKPRDEIVVKRGKGAHTKTYVPLHLAVYAAEHLSPEFHYEVIDTFINSKLLTFRDESGDSYKELCAMVKECAEPVIGKPAHNGHYITIAKLIQEKCGVLDWNIATAKELEMRKHIEDKITFSLKMGFIKDWEHFKQVIIEI